MRHMTYGIVAVYAQPPVFGHLFFDFGLWRERLLKQGIEYEDLPRKSGASLDGCALIWRTSRFRCQARGGRFSRSRDDLAVAKCEEHLKTVLEIVNTVYQYDTLNCLRRYRDNSIHNPILNYINFLQMLPGSTAMVLERKAAWLGNSAWSFSQEL